MVKRACLFAAAAAGGAARWVSVQGKRRRQTGGAGVAGEERGGDGVKRPVLNRKHYVRQRLWESKSGVKSGVLIEKHHVLSDNDMGEPERM